MIDYRAIADAVKSIKTNKPKQYHQWTENERYSIGKYAAENGYAVAAKTKKNYTMKVSLGDLRNCIKKR